MRLELLQDGVPNLGDTIVYCGDNVWCWQKAEKPVVRKPTVIKEVAVPVVKVDPRAMQLSMAGVCLALLALVVAVSATLKRHR